jgi:hypothetical protein
MFDTIATQVWTSLLASAVGDLALALTEEIEYGDALVALEDWQHRVLQFWAPRLFPELSDRGQAIDAVCHAAAGRERLPALFERTSLGIQEWVGSAGTFDGLVRVMTGEGV